MMVGGRVVVTVVSEGDGVTFNGWMFGLNGLTKIQCAQRFDHQTTTILQKQGTRSGNSKAARRSCARGNAA